MPWIKITPIHSWGDGRIEYVEVEERHILDYIQDEETRHTEDYVHTFRGLDWVRIDKPPREIIVKWISDNEKNIAAAQKRIEELKLLL